MHPIVIIGTLLTVTGLVMSPFNPAPWRKTFYNISPATLPLSAVLTVFGIGYAIWG